MALKFFFFKMISVKIYQITLFCQLDCQSTGLELLCAGLQRKILATLAASTTSLVQPSQLYLTCIMAGLAQVSYQNNVVATFGINPFFLLFIRSIHI